jgi:hypothetical protein
MPRTAYQTDCGSASVSSSADLPGDFRGICSESGQTAATAGVRRPFPSRNLSPAYSPQVCTSVTFLPGRKRDTQRCPTRTIILGWRAAFVCARR